MEVTTAGKSWSLKSLTFNCTQAFNLVKPQLPQLQNEDSSSKAPTRCLAHSVLRPNECRLLLLLIACRQRDAQRALSLTPTFQMGKLRPEKICHRHPVSHCIGFCVNGSRSRAVHPLDGCAWRPWPGAWMSGVCPPREWVAAWRAGGGLSHFAPLCQDGEGLTGPSLQRSLQMLLSIQGPRLHHPGRWRPRYLPAHL